MCIIVSYSPFVGLPWGVGPLKQPTSAPQSKPGQLEGSKGQSQPEMGAATFLILYLLLGRSFTHQVSIMTDCLVLLRPEWFKPIGVPMLCYPVVPFFPFLG